MYLRAFAILAVVGVHVFSNHQKMTSLGMLRDVNVLLEIFFRFAVPLFLLISGFVLTLNYCNTLSIKRFYAQRLKTLLIPYFMFSMAYLSAYGLQGGWPAWGEIGRRILMADTAPHLWFFRLIFMAYLLFPLFLRLQRITEAIRVPFGLSLIGLLVQLSAVVFIATMPSQEGSSHDLAKFLMTLPQFIFYLFLGMDAARHWEESRSRWLSLANRAWPVIALSVVLMVVWSGNAKRAGHALDATRLEPLMFGLTFVLCLVLSDRLNRSRERGGSRIFSMLGEYAFGIYLVHLFLMTLVFRLLGKVHISPDNTLFYPLLYAGTLAGSFAAVWVLHRTPLSRWLIGLPRHA